MTTLNIAAPWHKQSFDRFLNDGLPRLLAARLPLAGYQVQPLDQYICRVTVALAGGVTIEYRDIPQPDQEGFFMIEGQRRVIIPVASRDELDLAEIRCAGEQLYDYIDERLGEAPDDLSWSESLARTWLPLDTWAGEFLQEQTPDELQRPGWLDQANWLDRQTHLRRIYIKDREKVFTTGHLGRVCPFETPEGLQLGRLMSIATGAAIRDTRLVIVDQQLEATLGLTVSMIPLLEHDAPARLTLATEIMRHWITPPDPEPALVQTGNEPADPAFWCGRNLLTAFISWGAETFEDGIVISESCAARLGYPTPIEPGDMLGNRHGTRGVVSRILPDAQMPHLAGGTPVDLIFSFIGMHTRLNFGQVREALLGRIARAECAPALAPPFQAPGECELRERLVRAGLPETGMEHLTMGHAGPALELPSTVGWVYWGRLQQIARTKIVASVGDAMYHRHDRIERALPQMQGMFEYFLLRDAAAFENISEQFNTRAAERSDAATLARRVAEGKIEQAGPPTPKFAELERRLNAGGIRVEFAEGQLTFQFAPPRGETLTLARPVSHPWLRERRLSEIGVLTALPHYRPLAEANARLERMIAGQAPEPLMQEAYTQLENRVRAFFDALLTPDHLRFSASALFSGRPVIVPGADLRIDQVGVPEEIAWTLFGPLVARALHDVEEVHERSERATQLLDEIMAGSWVLVYNPVMHASFIAFHPVRYPDRAIRLHPLVCSMLSAAFDGDQAAIFLPITDGAQHEAGERLSVAGYLARDPKWIDSFAPMHEAMWGLARLGLTEAGRAEIAHLVQIDIAGGLLTKTVLAGALRALLQRDGIEHTLVILERLMRRGFEATMASGASISPFIGATLAHSPAPEHNDIGAWDAYAEEFLQRLAARSSVMDADMGAQILAVRSGARGDLRQLAWLIGPRSEIELTDIRGRPMVVRQGYRDGLAPTEMYALAIGSRERIVRISLQGANNLRELGLGYNVLVRAMRAKRPGIVFALAADNGETDPLLDIDSRLFVGLPVRSDPV